MEILKRFADALKEQLRELGQSELLTGDGGMHGCTETGFYEENIVDMDELDAQIDALVAEFAARGGPKK